MRFGDIASVELSVCVEDDVNGPPSSVFVWEKSRAFSVDLGLKTVSDEAQRLKFF